ncbi:hypothetical protein GJ654_17725 [Rhodoblastus acidophilus]|uniref:Uncharacterized protein n=1 Tax=Rhodoblastus acidophilus TaxID=1074 RepID=A0A6N8DUJ4_RHOAC|nr:hypothetical protein [Rhodoblastus acidophilus]MCW2276156.1 hypothetical protein [Rhodoblastus acidophilus]MTV32821.1 hypothetical protein [Rhodoblastus acidophilus]
MTTRLVLGQPQIAPSVRPSPSGMIMTIMSSAAATSEYMVLLPRLRAALLS